MGGEGGERWKVRRVVGRGGGRVSFLSSLSWGGVNALVQHQEEERGNELETLHWTFLEE